MGTTIDLQGRCSKREGLELFDSRAKLLISEAEDINLRIPKMGYAQQKFVTNWNIPKGEQGIKAKGSEIHSVHTCELTHPT